METTFQLVPNAAVTSVAKMPRGSRPPTDAPVQDGILMLIDMHCGILHVNGLKAAMKRLERGAAGAAAEKESDKETLRNANR